MDPTLKVTRTAAVVELPPLQKGASMDQRANVKAKSISKVNEYTYFILTLNLLFLQPFLFVYEFKSFQSMLSIRYTETSKILNV